MADETKTEDPNDKGLPPGVTHSDTGEGNRGEGAPKAPEINNAPPAKEGTEYKKAEPEKKQEEQPKEPDTQEEVPTEYPSYNDEDADAVVAILKEAQIPVAEAHSLFKEAIETGDFSKINVATLVEKLGKAKADLVLLGVKSYYTKETAKVKEIVKAAHDVVGGAANYTLIQDWARLKAAKDPEFSKTVQELNPLFNMGPKLAAIAAKELKTLYEADPNNKSLQIKQVVGDSAATTPETKGEYISRADYNAQIKKAHEKNDAHEINRLRALRLASLKQNKG